MNKIPLLLTCALASVVSTQAATIAYTFETPGNITDAGSIAESYSGPDSNDFGAGITVSAFTMTDRDATEYSRFTNIGSGSVAAALGHGANPLYASFTVTIDDTVTVDFTNISFDTSIRWNANNLININEQFTTSVAGGTAGNVTDSDWSKNVTANFLENPANNQSIGLTGLTGLTDTTVTFTWEFESSRNNTFANVASGLDNINLTGVSTAAVPEPSSSALLLGGLGFLLMKRRRA
ncbi:PEP-CTERM sorting domain-containing protein [Rubritalea sp.]|uniref:PEP-CTERM sorting domain-containing protein n=1 Tax=Rubritalea sp. TaxID=2109375 RepID=UPI003EF18481